MSARTLLSLVLGAFLAACSTGDIHDPPSDQPDATDEAFDVASLSPAEARGYLDKIAPPLLGRTVNPTEAALLQQQGGAAIDDIIEAWKHEPGLVAAARALMEEKLSVSGDTDDIDYSLPGNLVAQVVKNARPWSDILTSNSCYDAAGTVIACDSGAPFTAGVLTTRGYLSSRASRFNLTRSSTLLRAFTCQVYPQADDLEPRAEPARLRHLFSITDLSEASAEEIASAANPERACHDCHGQFAFHAQLFVKFDEDGIYRGLATGEQDPDGELGRSFEGLLASHFASAEDASSERGQILGVPVNNLAEAAHVIADHPLFLQCASQNLLEYTLRIDTAGPLGKTVDEEMLQRIAETASDRAEGGAPTFPDIVAATFTDPSVVETVITFLSGEDR